LEFGKFFQRFDLFLKETTVGQREDIEHGSPCAWGTEIRRGRNAAFEFAQRQKGQVRSESYRLGQVSKEIAPQLI
jgi:hypothetical protein